VLKHYEREKLIWDSSYEPFTKLLLLALNSFVDANGECWPSIETLMTMTAMSRNSVIRKVKLLAEHGVIINAERFDSNGRQTSNKYRLEFEKLGRVPQRDPGGATERPWEGATVAPDLSIEELFIEPIQKEQENVILNSQNHDRAFSENSNILEIEPEISGSGNRANSSTPLKQPEIDGKIEIQARSQKSSAVALAGRETANPERFDAWWKPYRKMCLIVGAAPGNRSEAWKEWQKNRQTYEASHFEECDRMYREWCGSQMMRNGKVIGVAHGCRYLRSDLWQDAFDRAALLSESAVNFSDPNAVKQAGKQLERQRVNDEVRELLARRAAV
jgi:Helix-turn-helix domain